MSDTPIIDEAVRQFCNLQEIGYTDVRVLIGDVLRAALPGDLLSHAVFDRAIELMRELYPEQFR